VEAVFLTGFAAVAPQMGQLEGPEYRMWWFVANHLVARTYDGFPFYIVVGFLD
jgi:hypothetical protein